MFFRAKPVTKSHVMWERTDDGSYIGRQTAYPCERPINKQTHSQKQVCVAPCCGLRKTHIMHPLVHAAELFLKTLAVFSCQLCFFVLHTLELVVLYARATHELRRGTEVVRERDLRLDLRHFVGDRLRVKHSVPVRVLMDSDLPRLSHCKVREIWMSWAYLSLRF